jgi:hypothetical protein
MTSHAAAFPYLTKPIAPGLRLDQPTTSDPTARMSIRDLAVANYSNGLTIWIYRADKDTARNAVLHRLDQILSPGYFRDACDMFARGDQIHVAAVNGGALLYVAEAREGCVRVMVMSAVCDVA